MKADLPPRLTNVGAKLLPDAIEGIVFEGKLHVRPVMATRMPMFSRDRLPGLAAAFAVADGPAARRARRQYTEKVRQRRSQARGNARVGMRELPWRGGSEVARECPRSISAACICGCGPDGSTNFCKIRRRLNRDTRMPSFWDHGDVAYKDIADGTMNGQIDAIWSLSVAG